MKYRNTITGEEIEVNSIIISGNWILVEETAKSKKIAPVQPKKRGTKKDE